MARLARGPLPRALPGHSTNKLTYDRQTKSLWHHMRSKPVVGPLDNSGIQLKPGPVLATAWRDWLRPTRRQRSSVPTRALFAATRPEVRTAGATRARTPSSRLSAKHPSWDEGCHLRAAAGRLR